VEDLMFDKSFNRSKDYFVALQLLRIVDEWLDEVVPSVKEIKENPDPRCRSFCAAEAEKNFDGAIRFIDEKAGAVQKRVRKKVEEINSLRDGVGPCSPIPVEAVANPPPIAIQRYVSPRVN
jgi:hypothetical protein